MPRPTGIARQRLAQQHLTDPGFGSAVEVVSAMGAVQAQDYAGALWAVARRTEPALTAADVEQAFEDAAIVRTHLLRPTWHFVAAADLRWIQALTAPRVHQANGYQYRQFGVDAELIKRSHAVLEKSLRDGRHLTRTELCEAWEQAGIDTSEPVRVAALLMWAELDLLVCSGPRRGRQFTYAMVDERVPPSPAKPRDEALAELARRYFSTRGPASLHDLCWWSGLTMADAKRAAGALGDALEREAVDGVELYCADPRPVRPRARPAHLLPNYDELFIGFRDRSALLQRLGRDALPNPSQAVFAHVVAIDAQVVGGWKRDVGTRSATVTMRLQVPVTATERRALEAEARRYGRFLGLPVELLG